MATDSRRQCSYQGAVIAQALTSVCSRRACLSRQLRSHLACQAGARG